MDGVLAKKLMLDKFSNTNQRTCTAGKESFDLTFTQNHDIFFIIENAFEGVVSATMRGKSTY